MSPLGKFWVISPGSCCDFIKHINIVKNHKGNIVQNLNYFILEFHIKKLLVRMNKKPVSPLG